MPADRHPPISVEDLAAEEALATRYVLGELSEEEFADFEARYASDAGFRNRYNEWSERLNAPGEDASVAQDTRAWTARLPQGLREMIGRLGVVPAVVGALLAALLVAFVTNMGLLGPETGAESHKTVLTAEDGTLVAEARLDPEDRSITLRMIDAPAAGEGVVEVWLVMAEGIPMSLGLVPDTEEGSVLSLTDQQINNLSDGALVMTIEPAGGAGDAGPTGDVVAAGAFATP